MRPNLKAEPCHVCGVKVPRGAGVAIAVPRVASEPHRYLVRCLAHRSGRASPVASNDAVAFTLALLRGAAADARLSSSAIAIVHEVATLVVATREDTAALVGELRRWTEPAPAGLNVASVLDTLATMPTPSIVREPAPRKRRRAPAVEPAPTVEPAPAVEPARKKRGRAKPSSVVSLFD